ncbi:MAG TPA: tyrosine-type recombinase/integrase [Terriglobales bacterium]|nr:tyrosine-type recombinase/integrase [Terriglobales bacterium]
MRGPATFRAAHNSARWQRAGRRATRSVWRTDGQKPRQRTAELVVGEVVELRRRGGRREHPDPHRLRGYRFRPTFCSRLAMAGVDIATVGQLAGHRVLQTTMRYSHLSPEHQQDAVERLARFGQVQTDTMADTDASDDSGELAQVLAVQ